MCGITGIYAFNEKGKSFIDAIEASVNSLSKRGPDDNGIFKAGNVALGHTRLSIIDTSDKASQPFTDNTGRYTIVFNGEIFNFREHRSSLISSGVKLRSESDTEVLLHLFIREKEKCLDKLNGFFAFSIYDKQEECLFIARNRLGAKPLYYLHDNDKFIFASEMKAMMNYGIKKTLDTTSLATYLHLNYIPAPNSIFKEVKKLEPGTYAYITKELVKFKRFYKIPYPQKQTTLTYENAQQKFHSLFESAVEKRLVSDVPLGSFLSGGLDSSAAVAEASKKVKHLKTFSIGFKDQPFFDETHYAKLVSDKFKTDHTVFSLSDNDLLEELTNILDYIDEPFADSSAIAVYILAKRTKKHVTVALSGDGADELLGGYNKHKAEHFLQNQKFLTSIINKTSFIWNQLPKSRNSKTGNIIRQLEKLSEGSELNSKERYWRWAGFYKNDQNLNLLNNFPNKSNYNSRKNDLLENINVDEKDINRILKTDMKLVLANDMLVKVDMMSMANSLEVRSPFLDKDLVNFCFSLPSEYKIDSNSQKKILRDTYKKILPQEIFSRSKKGFEVPLLKWFQTELRSMIENDLLSEKFLHEQNIFEINEIELIKKQLFSNDPGDSVAKIWGLIVFQYWWKKNLANA